MTLTTGAQVADGPMLAMVQHALQLLSGRGPAPLVVKALDTHLRQTVAPLHIATGLVGTWRCS